MSGIVGHSMYALLGLKAAHARKLPVALIAGRHLSSYVAGAYIGSDIQVMPEAICVDTGKEVGFATVPLAKSPITGGAVRPWKLKVGGQEFAPRQIYDQFYGRSHLVFGWKGTDREHAVPWDHLPDYFADVIEDSFTLYGPGERRLAYVLGWIVHVVSDSLIKSVQPGIELHLLDGKYTPRNRPIQDLVTYHEIGIKEFHLDWPALFADFASTPVEPVQLHYMRVGKPQGELAQQFTNGWLPDQTALLTAVLAENRRWCRFHAEDVVKEMQLVPNDQGRPDANADIRKSVGLDYPQMLELAAKANFRHALWQMGEAIAKMFEATITRSPRLAKLPRNDGPGWEEISRLWKRP